MPLSDSLAINLTFAAGLSDSESLTDGQILNLTFSASLSETEILSDAIGNLATFNGSLSDSLALLESQGLSPGYLFSDTESLSDSVSKTVANAAISRIPIYHLQTGLSRSLLDGS